MSRLKAGANSKGGGPLTFVNPVSKSFLIKSDQVKIWKQFVKLSLQQELQKTKKKYKGGRGGIQLLSAPPFVLWRAHLWIYAAIVFFLQENKGNVAVKFSECT